MAVVVNEALCVGCGNCEPSCPSDALKAWGYLEIDAHKCSECFVCIENCPVGALSEK